MKIKSLFNTTPTIEEYLQAYGIENVKKYLKPDKSCVEDCENYENMDKAFELIMNYIERSSSNENTKN